jgi:hypothetical protein
VRVHLFILGIIPIMERFYTILASEVTPGLQQEQSPTPINLCHDLFIQRGDRMEVNSKQCCSNSETRPGMHGHVRS